MSLYTESRPILHNRVPQFLEEFAAGNSFIHDAAKALKWESGWLSSLSWERIAEAARFQMARLVDPRKVALCKRLIRLCEKYESEKEPYLLSGGMSR